MIMPRQDRFFELQACVTRLVADYKKHKNLFICYAVKHKSLQLL